MSGAISVNGCVQISVDAFIDEMNEEKILTQNENQFHSIFVEAQPSIVYFINSINSCPNETDFI